MAITKQSLTSLERLKTEPRLNFLASACGGFDDFYLVGGTVRDLIMDRPCKDIDLAYAGNIEGLMKRAKKNGIRVIPTGLQHQTICLLPISDMPPVEVTSFRTPSDAGSLPPDIGGIELDLNGRDFTVNAVAFSLGESKLIDPFNGIEDIQNRLLRAVGAAETRFREDPLRILRMVRLAVTLDCSIDDAAVEAGANLCELIAESAPERIREELNQILLAKSPSQGFRLLQSIGVLKLLLPEFDSTVGFEQNSFHREDLFNHTLEVVDSVSPDLVLRLAALFHDIAKPHSLSVDEQGFRHFYRHESIGTCVTTEIMERFRYSKSVISDVVDLVRTHMRPVDAKAPGIRRIIRDTGDNFARWRELKEADSLACRFDPKVVAKQLEAFDAVVLEIRAQPNVSPLSMLAINGKDLLELGLSQGPEIGEL
jgi:tRNA nucleotidyltransferase (CCA-adding enzyme)